MYFLAETVSIYSAEVKEDYFTALSALKSGALLAASTSGSVVFR